jgi:phospholipase/carboxylesterase
MDNYDETLYYGHLFPESKRAIIMIHGRGADGADIVNSLEGQIPIEDFYVVAPNAANNTWYPYSFIAPQQQNQPELDSSLRLLKQLWDNLIDTGYKQSDIYLLGFSQGACLALEFAARNATLMGGVFALSGGLIGDKLNTANYSGNFANTPVFIGCSDTDSHIPLYRVKESAEIFITMGANVIEKIYPGIGHTINTDEISQMRSILTAAK